MKIDKTFIVSLEIRLNDRLIPLTNVLNEKGIDYSVFTAIQHGNGAHGLILTMEKLFTECLEAGDETIMVFEDDIKFLVDNPKEQIERCLSQLPENWDCLYLGVNLFQEKVTLFSDGLIKLTSGYSSHAIIYSKSGAKKTLEAIKSKSHTKMPYDEILVKCVQKDGNCFTVYPMIVSQLDGFSDILKKQVHYAKYLTARFEERTAHLKNNLVF